MLKNIIDIILNKWFYILLIIFLFIGIYFIQNYLKKNEKIISNNDTTILGKNSYYDVLPPFSYYYDFENIKVENQENVIYNNIAYSGNNSTKAFGKNSFSLIIEKKVSEIGINKLNKVAISGKVYLFPLRDSVQAALVFSILTDDNKSVYWQGIGINGKTNLPVNKWFNVSGEFDLKNVDLLNNYKIRIYLWNNSDNDILLDDLFIVFGQEPDRYGKSVVCDLTLKPFLNEGPPYPVKYLFKKNINTKNNLSLTNNPNDDFTTKQLLITGFFIDNKLQSIISFDKQPVLYHYCSEQNNFVGSLLKLNDNIIQLSPNYSNIYTADINYDGLDEIIIYDKKYKSLFVLKVNMNNHSIYSKKFSASLSVILDSKNFNENIKLNNDANIYIADFDNDTKIELLVAENNGQWTMYKFINNNLLEISRGKLKYFDGSKYDLNVYCGNIKGLETVALMFYGKNIKDENSIITIYKYSQKYKNFISILFPKDKDLIYFKSYDTIKKTDKFYFLKFKKDNFFLKYSSDKYFDLKIITYNNDTLKILYNVDFKGYDTDKNPKYYEHLKLIEGMFLYPDITSLLTISTLNLERKNQYFLDKVELYTFN